ncbi:hypothetical protein QKU48_gp0870 [Fadolivirus algeromassiliense]|jgi:hypothetical protein|uniref:Uncharacterized protein n=1 Tax=Fadolivirus FV1/VV64 TaxID=3070911 RepID=A0A7D3UQ59_9VIRU|nr:hypothetical protein QKU48_gp0870 [Fadolivirus algeromassiliense]QKF94328.1 hypothetical protein Fadolivirus_1_870 [Fadolivirus FV1/VV64]
MNNIGIIITITLLIFLLILNRFESFDSDMKEFVPLGYRRYDLMGQRLDTRPLDDCYYDQYMCYYNSFYPMYPLS